MRITKAKTFWLVALAALFLPFAAHGATQIYYIAQANLLNVPNNCGTSPPSIYSNCSSSPMPGFQWTDTLTAGSTVNSVKIEFNMGVDCAGAYTYTTLLNATSAGNLTGTSYCNCSPRTQIYTINAPVAAYKVAAANQFFLSNPNTCVGFNGNASLGASTPFARITVDYTAGGGGGSDPWPTPLPGGYAVGSAGYIVGTNLNAKVSSRADGAAYTPARAALIDNLAGYTAARAAKLDNLDAKVSTVASMDLLKRMEIESALAMGCPGNSGHDYKMSIYYLPEALGGNLGLVRTVLVETITNNQAAGLDVHDAATYLAAGDAASAAGQYREAWKQYKMAYDEATY